MNGYVRLTIAAAAFGLIPSQGAFSQDIGSRLMQDAKVRDALVAVEGDESRTIRSYRDAR